MAGPADVWVIGRAYEQYVGRWSRLIAGEFLAWLKVDDGAAWLDVGCGTGALSQAVLDAADPSVVVGIDPSAGFLTDARTRSGAGGARFAAGDATERLGGGRARFVAADARALPFTDARFDVVVSGLVLNFVPDPARAVRAMSRVTRAGGRVAAYVWDYSGRMELIRHFWDAAAALDPAAAELAEGLRFELCQPEPLTRLFETAGLADITVRPIEVPTRFQDFDDYWTPFLGGQGPAPSYAMSLEEPRRTALRDELRQRLPIAEDGSIHLLARAWAVAGAVRPAT